MGELRIDELERDVAAADGERRDAADLAPEARSRLVEQRGLADEALSREAWVRVSQEWGQAVRLWTDEAREAEAGRAQLASECCSLREAGAAAEEALAAAVADAGSGRAWEARALQLEAELRQVAGLRRRGSGGRVCGQGGKGGRKREGE